jgi:phosphate starvation-inducible membrane PsiE
MRKIFVIAGIVLVIIGLTFAARVMRIVRHTEIVGLGIFAVGIILLIFGLFTNHPNSTRKS